MIEIILAIQTLLPNRALTPGAVLPVTKDQICIPGYAKTQRHTSGSMKHFIYAEYGIPRHNPGDYEIDHLVSLELGGADSIANLWPQSYSGNWNAHMKDKLENWLHMSVCNGSIKLEDAQSEIKENWIESYRKHGLGK